MEKYCYSKDILLTRQNLLEEIDLSLFFHSDFLNVCDIKKLLEMFGIYSESIDYHNSTIMVRLLPVGQDTPLPNISNRYYNHNDQLFSTFSIQPSSSSLVSLEGEIFERLDLNLESAYQFCKEHNYQEFIYPETTSCIHFKGIEFNREKKERYDEMITNIGPKILSDKEQKILSEMFHKTKDTKEIYITKDSQKFMFYYNSPNIFNNRSDTSSLSVEEIGIIQQRILELLSLNGQQNMNIYLDTYDEYRNDNEKFLEYVYAYLIQYRKIVANKGYQEKSLPVLDSESLHTLKLCIEGKIPKGIYAKITIISDKFIQTTEEKNIEFMKTLLKK